jgi:hypothetical protein
MPFFLPFYVSAAAVAMCAANYYAWELANKEPVIIVLEDEPPEPTTEIDALIPQNWTVFG